MPRWSADGRAPFRQGRGTPRHGVLKRAASWHGTVRRSAPAPLGAPPPSRGTRKCPSRGGESRARSAKLWLFDKVKIGAEGAASRRPLWVRETRTLHGTPRAKLLGHPHPPRSRSSARSAPASGRGEMREGRALLADAPLARGRVVGERAEVDIRHAGDGGAHQRVGAGAGRVAIALERLGEIIDPLLGDARHLLIPAQGRLVA
jgi:hypothetical protein